MKWILCAIILSLLSVFAPLYYVFGQDAPLALLLEAMKRLEDSDMHITNLKKDITGYQTTIGNLSRDREKLQQLNRQQQTESETAFLNLRKEREAYQSRSMEYQQTIQRLSDSYNDILISSQNKDKKLAALKERNRIFLLWGIIATAAAIIPWIIKLLVRKIKR